MQNGLIDMYKGVLDAVERDADNNMVFETDEITVCLNGSTHQIFADLRDLFRPKFQTPAHDFSHMTALEILLKYY